MQKNNARFEITRGTPGCDKALYENYVFFFLFLTDTWAELIHPCTDITRGYWLPMVCILGVKLYKDMVRI